MRLRVKGRAPVVVAGAETGRCRSGEDAGDLWEEIMADGNWDDRPMDEEVRVGVGVSEVEGRCVLAKKLSDGEKVGDVGTAPVREVRSIGCVDVDGFGRAVKSDERETQYAICLNVDADAAAPDGLGEVVDVGEVAEGRR